MANITPYKQQTSPRVGELRVGQMPVRPGANPLAGMAETLEKIRQQEARSEISEAQKRLAAIRAEATVELAELEASVPLDDKTFVAQAQAIADKFRDRGSDLGSPEARRFWDENFANLAANIYAKAGVAQTARVGKKATLDFVDANRSRAHTVMEDPSQYDAVLAEVDSIASMENGPWSLVPAEQRDRLIWGAKNEIAVSAINGMLDDNPWAARSALDSGKFNEYLDTDVKARLGDEADREIRRLAERAFRINAKNQIESKVRQAFADGNISLANIKSSVTATDPATGATVTINVRDVVEQTFAEMFAQSQSQGNSVGQSVNDVAARIAQTGTPFKFSLFENAMAAGGRASSSLPMLLQGGKVDAAALKENPAFKHMKSGYEIWKGMSQHTNVRTRHTDDEAAQYYKTVDILVKSGVMEEDEALIQAGLPSPASGRAIQFSKGDVDEAARNWKDTSNAGELTSELEVLARALAQKGAPRDKALKAAAEIIEESHAEIRGVMVNIRNMELPQVQILEDWANVFARYIAVEYKTTLEAMDISESDLVFVPSYSGSQVWRIMQKRNGMIMPIPNVYFALSPQDAELKFNELILEENYRALTRKKEVDKAMEETDEQRRQMLDPLRSIP